MNQISFDEFYETYKVRRNPIQLMSQYNNTMLDSDEEELECIEEENPKNVWTLVENKEGNFILTPGIVYKHSVIGYFICNKVWDNNKENFILI